MTGRRLRNKRFLAASRDQPRTSRTPSSRRGHGEALVFSSIFHGNRDRIEYFVLIWTLFILNDRFLPSLTMNQTANRFVDESKKISASTVNIFCMDNNYLLYFFSNFFKGVWGTYMLLRTICRNRE